MTVQLSPVLQSLHDSTVKRLVRQKEIEPERELRRIATFAREPLPFHPARSGSPAVIAEIKFASPSEGRIALSSVNNPVGVASSYLKHGAAAISVLTEPNEFQGDIKFLRLIRNTHPEALLLMKDFVIDWYQLLQARAYGADAVLLIVDFIDRDLLRELYLQALWLGLTPLVEVHSGDQLEFAIDLGAELIGVNNRDLSTMEVSLENSVAMEKIVKHYSLTEDNRVFITESGIRTGEDIARLSRAGYHALLIGTTLMKTPDPGVALDHLRREAVRVALGVR